MNYQRILAGADAEARDDYDYDPRVAFQRTVDAGPDVTPHQDRHPRYADNNDKGQATIDELSQPQFNSTLTLPVQSQPSMIKKKRSIIIDSAQRDWTIQPDAYANIFSFGNQIPLQTVGPQTPFYFNNTTIPLAAWESPVTPPAVSSGARGTIQTVPNNVPQPFPVGVSPPAYFSKINQGLVRPTYGWKIVLKSGKLIHSPTVFSYSDPTINVYFYPVYDPAEPSGAQIGIDIQPKQYGTSSYTYATQLALSNICEIKLVRAILPVRGTQPYTPSAFTGSNIEYPLSLHNQPYLLMTIQNLKGNYLGGSQIVQQAFTVLTQNTRNFYEGNVSYQCQFSDFHPWGDEAYIFDPPMAKLSNANIQLYNPAGNVFSQLDNLSIIDLALDPVTIGKVKFYVTQTTSNKTFGDCNAFLATDIRVGDEIAFYTPALAQIASDASCNPFLSGFTSLLSNNFLVTDICGTDFVPRSVFPTISRVGTSFTAVPKVAGYAGMSNAVVTVCGLLRTLSQVCLQQYTTAPTGMSWATKRSLTQDYAIPMMNLNTQATFVLEVTTLEPDTTNIQKIIPN